MKKLYFFLLLLSVCIGLSAQSVDSRLKLDRIGKAFTAVYQRTFSDRGKVNIDSFFIDTKKKKITIYSDIRLSYLPMREQLVYELYDSIRFYLPVAQKKYKLKLLSDGVEISTLIPNNFRASAKDKSRMIRHSVKEPLVKNISSPTQPFQKGLWGNHLALWNSHGWYYEQKLGRWEWQRARIFQTVEDLYTQSYVLPFLAPMLENAGANLLLPRERDFNPHETIADNDNDSGYSEIEGKEQWQTTPQAGFAHTKSVYLDGENPFRMGTARQVKTVSGGKKESKAVWNISVKEKGAYGVYVSYQSFKNSADDARYTVYHSGGQTSFSVNQQMGGGTWIFLGYFPLDASSSHRVELTNRSARSGKIIVTDAVKIGGGMGNIARMPNVNGFEKENTKSSETSAVKENSVPRAHYVPETSGYPRFAEGARYWMQWAGVPDSVYNRTQGKNDYTDDYAGRGYWVNWLSGGSSVNPKAEGLRVPIDLAFAFHTDAGTFWGDSIVGTLGIFMTHHNKEKFDNGYSRWASRDLTDLIMTEITADIRREFEPNWTRRPMWNRSYAEARVPNVPTMLLELLSHQNFADMRYGLDPAFRFTVSRSIYKGMLKFLASQYHRPYVVQPLPVKDFSIRFSREKEVLLSWQPTPDASEPSASPSGYIVYTRVDDGGFDNGKLVHATTVRLPIEEEKIYSYKIEAVNDGGKSFPSEILSVCRKANSKAEVLIVNGFTRVSAPYSFTASNDSLAGFDVREDYGVPYLLEHQFIGSQHEFRRVIPWMDDDASGFGDSYANMETQEIAGNTFDYPFVHGKAFAEAGYSFVSCAASAVEKGDIRLSDYPIVDWILGKQREWSVARGAKPPKFKTFSRQAQQAITDFCKQGGKIIVSGAYVGTDLWDNPFSTNEDKIWAKQTLKFQWRNNRGALEGRIKAVASPFPSIRGDYNYYHKLNRESYIVENPDAIEPADSNAFTVFRYSENNLSAGILYKGATYSTCILGFPFESLTGQDQRNRLIKDVLNAM